MEQTVFNSQYISVSKTAGAGCPATPVKSHKPGIFFDREIRRVAGFLFPLFLPEKNVSLVNSQSSQMGNSHAVYYPRNACRIGTFVPILLKHIAGNEGEQPSLS